jgi:hypothetical protein
VGNNLTAQCVEITQMRKGDGHMRASEQTILIYVVVVCILMTWYLGVKELGIILWSALVFITGWALGHSSGLNDPR